MALNGKYVSLKEVINRVYLDTEIDLQIGFDKFIEWTVQALNKIGHPLQYKRRVTGYEDNPNLDIENYRAKLPCNLYQIQQIAVNGCVARYSSDSFHHLLGGECCGGTATEHSTIEGYTGGFYIDGFGNEFNAGLFNNLVDSDITYDVNDDYLTLSVKEGEVCIAYLEFPVDDEGLPLIPDHENYITAVEKYITMKIDYAGWRRDLNNTGKRALYNDSKRDWHLYAGSAASTAKSPSIDQMETMKNSLLRTFKSYNAHGSGFKYMGAQQQRRIK